MTLELKSLKSEAAALLEADSWTVEKLAVATVKELVAYKGIGRVGAAKIIAEAVDALNATGLEEAEGMATEHYYKKFAPETILKDWEADGLGVKTVALSSSARALAALKGIGEALALQLISAAQNIVNERGLYQSQTVLAGPVRQTNAAFDEKWLSGEVEPAMSIRVRRNFEVAQREYRAAND